MEDIRRKLEDNYLAFISIATGAVVLIALAVWGITLLVKKMDR